MLSKFFTESVSKYFLIDLDHTFYILIFFIVSLRNIIISEVISILKIAKWYLPLLCSAKLCVHRDCYETCVADYAPIYPGKRWAIFRTDVALSENWCYRLRI